jgi:hypothetical protein
LELRDKELIKMTDTEFLAKGSLLAQVEAFRAYWIIYFKPNEIIKNKNVKIYKDGQSDILTALDKRLSEFDPKVAADAAWDEDPEYYLEKVISPEDVLSAYVEWKEQVQDFRNKLAS